MGQVLVTIGSSIYTIDTDDNVSLLATMPSPLQGASWARFVGSHAYFTDSDTDRLLKFDPYTSDTAVLTSNDFPQSITANDDDLFLGSGSPTDLKITRVDRAAFTATTSASLAGQPASIAWLDPYVWFVSFDRNVRAYDPVTDAVVSTLQLPVNTEARVILAHDGYLYVGAQNTDKVHKIDPSGSTSVANVSVGSTPSDMIVAADDLYVANLNSDTVSRIDLSSFTVSATITGFSTPARLATNDAMLWATNTGGNSVARVDLSGSTISATIAMPGTPRAMAYVPDRATTGIFVGAVVF